MMMNNKWLAFSLIFTVLMSCGTTKETIAPLIVKNADLNYTITPNLKAEKPYVQIDFQVQTNDKGELYLAYPNADWGEENLFNCLSEFKTVPELKVEFKKENNQIYLNGKSEQKITVSYKLIQDFVGDSKSENTYRAQVNSNYFHVFGKSLFMIPQIYFDNKTLPFNVNLTWILPNSDFEIVHSFGSSKNQNFISTYDDFSSSIFLGGKLNTTVETVNDEKIVFSTPDQWEHVDIALLNKDLNKIIQQQRNFWNDHSTKLQTVTLIKTHEECYNYDECNYGIGGTGLTNSFACMSSDNVRIDNNQLNWLLSHEMFHHWVGNTIQNQNEEKEYWFSEGFTDYYSYKLMLRTGMLTPTDFINKVNKEIIKPHYSSPNKSATNEEITKERFWSDYEWEKLPYRRGWLYAFYLDAQIKNINIKYSLDDVMRDILKITQDFALPLNQDVFLQALEPYVNGDFRPEFNFYIETGQPINLQDIKVMGLYFDEADIPYMFIDGDIGMEELLDFLTK